MTCFTCIAAKAKSLSFLFSQINGISTSFYFFVMGESEVDGGEAFE
jgi:hypothetical protein